MSGYCKYCDSLIDKEQMIQVFDSDTHHIIWVGCLPCYKKLIELMHNETVTK